MPLLCPECSNGSLVITHRLELGSDAASDEVSLQSLRCSTCGLTGIGVYEESRRGADDSFHHYGYRMKSSDFELFTGQLRSCTTPRDPRCTCKVHSYFRLSKKNGRLFPLTLIEHSGPEFQIHYSR